MRWINQIVVHSTGTDTTKTAKDFFKDGQPMYHLVIERDGETVTLHDSHRILDSFKDKDFGSVHIAYVGGIDKEGKPVDNRSRLQKEAMFYQLVALSVRYKSARIKNAQKCFETENDPGFDVREWMKNYDPDFVLDKFHFKMAA